VDRSKLLFQLDNVDGRTPYFVMEVLDCFIRYVVAFSGMDMQ
jgi:hypothetical protein